MAEKESTISRLQAEKEELESQLEQQRHATRTDVKLSKVNEARRKKIQELEQELKDRKRALQETNKMLRMHDSSGRDMERLKRDIIVSDLDRSVPRLIALRQCQVM